MVFYQQVETNCILHGSLPTWYNQIKLTAHLFQCRNFAAHESQHVIPTLFTDIYLVLCITIQQVSNKIPYYIPSNLMLTVNENSYFIVLYLQVNNALSTFKFSSACKYKLRLLISQLCDNHLTI